MTPRRSVLYLPASNARAVEKARGLPADVVILDLEDAVGPEEKAGARTAALEALTTGGFRAFETGVRVNGLDTPWGEADLALLAPVARLVVAPKVGNGADAARYAGALSPGAALWAMIETPGALFNLDVIAATPGLSALMLGVNDLGAALGTGRTPGREPLQTAMSLTVAAARSHGLSAIDGVFNAITDHAGLEAECRQGRLWGFDGKSLIHPGQIETANKIFAPSAEELALARAIADAFDKPENRERGVIRVNGVMAERLHLEEARRRLALHDLLQTA